MPIQTLIKHKDFFEWCEKVKEYPDISDNRMNDILGAFQKLNPQYVHDNACASCAANMIKQAHNILKEYLKSNPVNYTFPKHEKE